jgi:transposase
MDICSNTNNKHFRWSKRLLDKYFEYIVAHVTYDISAENIYGTNYNIKAMRRQGFGYPDFDCFF